MLDDVPVPRPYPFFLQEETDDPLPADPCSVSKIASITSLNGKIYAKFTHLLISLYLPSKIGIPRSYFCLGIRPRKRIMVVRKTHLEASAHKITLSADLKKTLKTTRKSYEYNKLLPNIRRSMVIGMILATQLHDVPLQWA